MHKILTLLGCIALFLFVSAFIMASAQTGGVGTAGTTGSYPANGGPVGPSGGTPSPANDAMIPAGQIAPKTPGTPTGSPGSYGHGASPDSSMTGSSDYPSSHRRKNSSGHSVTDDSPSDTDPDTSSPTTMPVSPASNYH